MRGVKPFDVFRDLTTKELAHLDPSDRAALMAEAEAMRIEAVKVMGHVPPEAGPEIPSAPARGPVRMFDMIAAYPKGDDGYEHKRAGFMGRKTLQRADAFDVMAAKAARHKKPSPLTPSQVSMGRFYRDLVERHTSAGVRCSSLESLSQRSAGGGGEYIDAVLRDRDRIEIMRRRIGSGSAMVVRRIRPSTRGSRVAIMDRTLVDMVCLQDMAISDVLRAHGWAIKADLVRALQAALGAALGRMMGPVSSSKISAVHFEDGPVRL